MSLFPPTSLTLLQKLAATVAGGTEAAWVRFFNLYTPAIRRFVEWNDRIHDPDDVIQEVYMRLVEILRTEKYQPDKARFRTFLAMLIRRQLVTLYRRDQARGGAANISLEAMVDANDDGARSGGTSPAELSVPATQPDEIDLAWARAKHAAAVEHVLTKTALSTQSKRVYRAHVLEGRSAGEVAAEFGISKNLVGQIKSRVDRAISIIEEEFAEDASTGCGAPSSRG